MGTQSHEEKHEEPAFMNATGEHSSPEQDSWIDPAALASIPVPTLYHPCCGNDLEQPLSIFMNHISWFVFVDKAYHNPTGYKVRYDSAPRFLSRAGYKRTERTEARLDPDFVARKRMFECYIEPISVNEKWIGKKDKRSLTVTFRKGSGINSLLGPSDNRLPLGEIGVFFYRGDSFGEGGSAIPWGTKKEGPGRSGKYLLDLVLERMPPGALLVTDGSNMHLRRRRTDRHSPWYPLTAHGWSRTEPQRAFQTARPFFTPFGRLMTPVGYAGLRYGPTLAWRVD